MEGRQLEWYRYLVHNRTVAGSLFTLVHVPFMLSFLSLVIMGAALVDPFDPVVLGLALAVVALLLYGEHSLDDMTSVGKPWATVLTDRALMTIAGLVFTAAGIIGLYASFRFGTAIPFIGVLVGVLFCILYAMEIWKFHAIAFGALGMGAVLPMSYLAQSVVTGSTLEYTLLLLCLVAGFVIGFLILWLYEQTKTPRFRLMWRLLAVQFTSVFAISGSILIFWYVS